MPVTHIVALPPNATHFVRPLTSGSPRAAQILHQREKEVYVHYIGYDKRLDEWVSEDRCFIPGAQSNLPLAPNPHSYNANNEPQSTRHTISSGLPSQSSVAGPSSRVPRVRLGAKDPEMYVHGPESVSAPVEASTTKKRKRLGRPPKHSIPPREILGILAPESASVSPAPDGEGPALTEEEFDIQQHKKITAQRNFENVHFGEWQVKTWYFSPYPLTETELEDPAIAADANAPKIPGVARTTVRSHGRTSDLLAGGLSRSANMGTEKSQLWVCQQCFKYMAEGTSYDLHLRYCTVDNPPGKRVYQRGAHSIWEVDGATQKLYCQNLALFGKLFIDVKTLYFDLDNFYFYILTESTSKQDLMLGYFSKEKNSYDDYNLATIMTLPPYQRKGYGMLMIEFSYELSRRAGKFGTPERPLSDLGLRSYLAYWVSTLVRFFRTVLSTLPSETMRITHYGRFPGIERTNSGESEPDSGSGDVSRANSNSGNNKGSSVNGNGTENGAIGTNGAGSEPKKKKYKKAKGWAGEVEDEWPDKDDVPFPVTDPVFTSLRHLVTQSNKDGSATTHVMLNCTLADIARATNLRVDDAAFALNEVGLLAKRIAVAEGSTDVDEKPDTVVLTRAMVERVAKERNVKRPCMRLAYIKD